MSGFAIVTATLDYPRAKECVDSWINLAHDSLSVYLVGQTAGRADWEVVDRLKSPGKSVTIYGVKSREILGVVPAFNMGVRQALHDGAHIIACLHDDLLIEEEGWDVTVQRLFKACPRAGLVGFGGAKGLGAADIYQVPYHPMQLARQRFLSNMRDAEAHGERVTLACPVACLDGFSQIGLAHFWLANQHPKAILPDLPQHKGENLFDIMERWGVIHHFYDGMLGCFAKRLGYQVWLSPIKCHHYGGRTAVADSRYADWAASKTYRDSTGDAAFWEQAHAIGYEQFRDVLPIRV